MFLTSCIFIFSIISAFIFGVDAEISLSEFQAIVNFPKACSKAYNQKIENCSPVDFRAADSCSAKCHAALLAVQTDIQKNCVGVGVDPGTVIAYFFLGNGPEFVCSGIPITVPGSSASTSTGQESLTSTSTSESIPTSTSTEVSQSTETTESTQTSTETSSASSSISKTETSQSKTETSQSKTETQATPTTITSETVSSSSTSTTSSQPRKTSSSNPYSFSGGGSPFDTQTNGAAETTSAAAEKSFWLMIALVLVGFKALI